MPDPYALAALAAVFSPTSLTMTLHRLHQLPSASLSHQPLPRPAQPLPSFLGGRQGGEALSQPRLGGAGPSRPFPRPNSISKFNEFAEEPGELTDATPCRLGGSGPATERAAARAGRALGSIESGGGTE